MIKNFSRHIHQIWLTDADKTWNQIGRSEYTQNQKTYLDFCERKNWRYTLWNNKSSVELVKNHFPNYYNDYIELDSIIKKVDCIRLMALYVYGGVYVDMDTILKRDLDDLLNSTEIKRDNFEHTLWDIDPILSVHNDYDIIVGQERSIFRTFYNKFGYQILKLNNAVIFCKPKLKVINEIIELGFKRKHNGILDSFGVHTFSLKLYDEMCKFMNDILDNEDTHAKILTLPYIYFNEVCDVDIEENLSKLGRKELINDTRQYIIHTYSSDWDIEHPGLKLL